MSISITNYVDNAREDIITMAKNLGAPISRAMSFTSTHLICASPIGEKYTKATTWNLHIVNHLWLEETYAKWTYQREGKLRYQHFPLCIGNVVNKLPVHEVSHANVSIISGDIMVSELEDASTLLENQASTKLIPKSKPFPSFSAALKRGDNSFYSKPVGNSPLIPLFTKDGAPKRKSGQTPVVNKKIKP